ncbi:MAG: ribosome silencing factor [Bacteroidaceae bacterium]
MNNKLVDSIVAGIQEKKGRNITIVDLTSITDVICEYFVICQANSSNQIGAVVDSIKVKARELADERPSHVQGLATDWAAMDYGHVMVHILLPEAHDYYKLESLWADATLTEIKNLD